MIDKPSDKVSCERLVRNSKQPRHGFHGTPAYVSWKSMRGRCHNPNYASFKHYGGKGIVVCNRWRANFLDFLQDMGERPAKTTIERKNSALHYSCGRCQHCKDMGWSNNCKWADAYEQNGNRSINVWLTCKGETKLQHDWTKLMGFNAGTIHNRLKKGWSVERAILTPISSRITKI